MVQFESNTTCALIICRDGALPAGSAEAFDLAGRSGVVIGVRAAVAGAALPGPGRVLAIEANGTLSQLSGCWPSADFPDTQIIVIPASPDGRDVAPLIAAKLGRPFISGVTRIRQRDNSLEVTALRADGLVDHVHLVDVPIVVTLIPGLGGELRSLGDVEIAHGTATFSADCECDAAGPGVVSVAVLPPDPTTMDLTEATTIVAGGQGLGSKERFDQLGRIGAMVGASLGGTRVASDAGWIPFERQIGTTGVAVNPRTYVAFGISGATQHTSGLGSPDHIISINTDASCPMMSMANVAIVSDAQAVLDALESKLRARMNVESPL
jgi:electron transfer flavoprotein alpha subunit